MYHYTFVGRLVRPINGDTDALTLAEFGGEWECEQSPDDPRLRSTLVELIWDRMRDLLEADDDRLEMFVGMQA